MREAPGSPSNPVSDERLREKFCACVTARFDRERAEALADAVETLEEQSLETLGALLRGEER